MFHHRAWLRFFAGFCLLTLIQVINRYAIGLQMFWTEEVALLLFVWSVMIGLPVTIWLRQEIAVDLIHLEPGRAADLLAGSAWVLSMVFLVLLAVAGVMLIDRVGNDLTPALGIPRWVAYSSIPVGAGLGALALAGRRFYRG